jgi:hypothetical protein
VFRWCSVLHGAVRRGKVTQVLFWSDLVWQVRFGSVRHVRFRFVGIWCGRSGGTGRGWARCGVVRQVLAGNVGYGAAGKAVQVESEFGWVS